MTTKLKIFLLLALMTLTLPVAAAEILPTIQWQPQSLRLVAEKGCYARIIRLQNGEILCCYQRAKQCRIKRSLDEGKTWIDETCVTSYKKGIAANPELLQLKNGRLMLCYNERPNDPENHFTIMVVFSSDNGASWSKAEKIFEAGHNFGEGCWEPAPLQYPDGEIQIFFANEASYTYSNEQEISVIRSKDNGENWQGPKTLSYRTDNRDGMPVPCLLNDGKTVVVAIEDNGLNGPMKPVILRDTLYNRWQTNIIKGNSKQRESALLKPLPKHIYAGAPYIRQMPSSITVLSIQSRERRAYEEPAVYVGDRHARNFTNRTYPLKLASEVEGSWNSLFVKDAETVTLISTTQLNGKKGIWIIDGTIETTK